MGQLHVDGELAAYTRLNPQAGLSLVSLPHTGMSLRDPRISQNISFHRFIELCEEYNIALAFSELPIVCLQAIGTKGRESRVVHFSTAPKALHELIQTVQTEHCRIQAKDDTLDFYPYTYGEAEMRFNPKAGPHISFCTVCHQISNLGQELIVLSTTSKVTPEKVGVKIGDKIYWYTLDQAHYGIGIPF